MRRAEILEGLWRWGLIPLAAQSRRTANINRESLEFTGTATVNGWSNDSENVVGSALENGLYNPSGS